VTLTGSALRRQDHAARHAVCITFCVNSDMGQDKRFAVRVDPIEFEQECEAWDWVRAAGVSAQDLRKAVRESLSGVEALAEAA
jgi:hypothetical protein